jgi:hypothetical protein
MRIRDCSVDLERALLNHPHDAEHDDDGDDDDDADHQADEDGLKQGKRSGCAPTCECNCLRAQIGGKHIKARLVRGQCCEHNQHELRRKQSNCWLVVVPGSCSFALVNRSTVAGTRGRQHRKCPVEVRTNLDG